MRGFLGRVACWAEGRGVGPGPLRALFSKPIPPNVGWIHTLGSLLLLYLGFQVLTGALLALYTTSSVHDAYASVGFIRDELFLGAFLLKLHRFGAGFVLVTAFLHLVRSFFMGAYKAPRELLWMSGLAVGLLLTLFAFTGQLLPYDQRGYWATVVGIDIASSAPIVGTYVKDLLTAGYGEIGATTLSRFYALHISVLPALLVGGIVLHLSILQRVGSAGPLSGEAEDRAAMRRFFPSQVLKDVVVAAGGALLLCAVAATSTLADSGPADPSAGSFVPRPEWYFLSHYELLRWLPKTLGAFVVPNVVIGLLFLLPFLDRGTERRPSKRKLVVGAGALFFSAVIGLTAYGISNAPEPSTGAAEGGPVLTGAEVFAERGCIKCHTIDGQGGDKGPRLDHVGSRLRPDYLPAWIRKPQNFDPETDMPAFEGSEEELRALVRYLQDHS